MNKNLFFCMSFALTACAGGPIIPSGDLNREPASNSKIVFSTDKKSIPLCGNLPSDPEGVAANYVGNLALSAKQTRITYETFSVEDYGKCESALPEEGRSKGDWKGFYGEISSKNAEGSAKGPGQASQLREAVKGLDSTLASELVPYFRGQRPRNWKEFSDRITIAAQEIKKRTGRDVSWKQAVLGRYKHDNILNLGLLPTDGCPVVTHDETMETAREELSPARIVVQVEIRGGKLLPEECEKHVIAFNGSSVTGYSDSSYNVYVNQRGKNSPGLAFQQDLRSGTDVIATFHGKREAIPAEDYIEEGASRLSLRGSEVTLTIEHPLLAKFNRIPEFVKNCHLSMTASVHARSHWWSTDSNPLKSETFELTDGDRTVRTISGVSMKTDAKGYLAKSQVSYTTQFAKGCPFFNTRPSPADYIGE